MPPGRGYRNPKAKTPSRKKAKATGPTPRASARAREVASPNARFNRGFANEFNPKRDTTTPTTTSRKVVPGKGGVTPRPAPRPTLRSTPSPVSSKSPLEQFISGIGQLGARADAAAKRIFPAGRGSTTRDAMRVGQDENNPLKRILRGQ